MFTEKIELLLIKRKMSKVELATRLNSSQQNLYAKMKKDDFRESDMQKIAAELGCHLEINLVMNDTNERF